MDPHHWSSPCVDSTHNDSFSKDIYQYHKPGLMDYHLVMNFATLWWWMKDLVEDDLIHAATRKPSPSQLGRISY